MDLAVVPHPGRKEGRNVDHLCLRVEPFNEPDLVAHLKRHGVAPLGSAEINFGAEGDGLSLYFPDPDGNIIELKGPPDAGVASGP